MEESEQKLMKTRLGVAWPKERLRKLGPLQAKLLAKFSGQTVAEYKGMCPPEAVLRGLLEDVEQSYPEELIPLSKLLPPQS
jgi:hypothetical protein